MPTVFDETIAGTQGVESGTIELIIDGQVVQVSGYDPAQDVRVLVDEEEVFDSFDEYIPLDGGVIDVEAYGITPFVGPMDPQLWVDMITATIGNGAGTTRVFYFKYEGVYEFTNRLPWESDDGTLQSGVEILGKSRDGTIIRLQSRAQGYQNPYDCPKSFIRIDSQFNASSPTNNAFWCSIRQCTIEIGAGNPAAVAIEFNTNNEGHCRNVRIRSEDGQGITGIGYGYRSYANGPSIAKNVIIEGFDHSVSTNAIPGEINGSVTLEDIDAIEPRIAGLYLFKVFSMSIRGFRYRGKGPGVLSYGRFSHLVLLDSDLQWTGTPGEDWQPSAINLRGPNTQFSSLALIRNVQTSGFDYPIRLDINFDTSKETASRGTANVTYPAGTGVAFAGDYISEFVNPPQPTPAVGNPGTLGLTIQDTPEQVFTDASDFVSIESFGATRHGQVDAANPANSSLAAIQAAIDSGAAVVYAQGSTQSPEREPTEGIVFYGIDGPILLRGSLRKLMSLGHCGLVRSTGYTGPLFMGEDGSVPLVEIYGWWNFQQNGLTYQINSARSFLIRYCYFHDSGYIDVDGNATVFIEDLVMSQKSGTPSPDAQQVLIHSGSKVFMRHFNPESDEETLTHIRNDGGELWVLGYKTEIKCASLHNLNGAKSEILGGYSLVVGQPAAPNAYPLWVNEDSQLCFSMVTATYDGAHPIDPVIRETVGASVTDINRSQVSAARPGFGVALYTGQKP